MEYAEFKRRLGGCEWGAGAIKIRHANETGIAIKLGEGLMEGYPAGDIIIFWAGGDHGIMHDDDELEILEENLFKE